jgi:hypothetical protein
MLETESVTKLRFCFCDCIAPRAQFVKIEPQVSNGIVVLRWDADHSIPIDDWTEQWEWSSAVTKQAPNADVDCSCSRKQGRMAVPYPWSFSNVYIPDTMRLRHHLHAGEI